MKSKTLIQGKCDVCGEPVLPGKTQAQFNRNLGLHKRKLHKIESPRADLARAYRENKKKKKLEAAALANGNVSHETTLQDVLAAPQPVKRRPYRRRKQLGFSTAQLPSTTELAQKLSGPQVQPVKLPECPCCGSRFYVAKGE
jgi:hypothetical protein